MNFRMTILKALAVLGILALATTGAHASWITDLRVAYEFDLDVSRPDTVSATAGTVNQTGTLRDNAHVAGGVLVLDGSVSGGDGTLGDHMNLGSNQLSGGTTLTHAAWVKLDSYDGTLATITRIHNGGFNFNAWNDRWAIEWHRTAGGNQPLFANSAGDANSPSQNLGEWMHVLATYDADDETAIWINGVKANFAATTSAGLIQGGTVFIGSNHSGGAQLLHGQIDDWAVWSRVLTETEITALAGQAGLAPLAGYHGRTTPTGVLIPEPSSIVLLLAGVLGLLLVRRRK